MIIYYVAYCYYSIKTYTLEVVPFITFVTPNHLSTLICRPAQAIQFQVVHLRLLLTSGGHLRYLGYLDGVAGGLGSGDGADGRPWDVGDIQVVYYRRLIEDSC